MAILTDEQLQHLGKVRFLKVGWTEPALSLGNIMADLLDTIDSVKAQLAEAQDFLRQAEGAVKDMGQDVLDLRAQLAPNPACGHRMADLVTEHVWTGCQQGGSPVEESSTEWVRYCKNCGMEDTCEDPMPPCHCRICAERDQAVREARLEESVWMWGKDFGDAYNGGYLTEMGRELLIRRKAELEMTLAAQPRGK